MTASAHLLEVRNLSKFFTLRKGMLQRAAGHVRAVDDVSFFVDDGETLGLVGESGCGKTTTGRALLRLVPPSAGEILFKSTQLAREGEAPRLIDVATATEKELKVLRREMQIIFQDPFSSLNPRMNVGQIVSEPLDVQRIGRQDERRDRVGSLLESVGLNAKDARRYPHEFSGGQRQRIGIARALALEPRLIVADEPVSALDASIQAQVLNLMLDLQNEHGLAFVLIAHDLAVVRHISDRIAVMYLGRLVELASTDALFESPQHPYTEALMAAVPIPDPDRERAKDTGLLGDVPSATSPPVGCHFHPRCRYAEDICKTESPPLREIQEGHTVACHLADTIELRSFGS